MSSILLVDDERSIRMTFAVALEEDDHEVITAANAEEAWKLLHDRDIDVVVSDIMMPGMHGVALLEMLAESGCDLEVILVTGYPTAETAIRAIRAGAFDYLPKPVFSSHLRKAVMAAGACKAKRMEIKCAVEAKRVECRELTDFIAASLDGAVSELERRTPVDLQSEADAVLLHLRAARGSVDLLRESVEGVEYASSGGAKTDSPSDAPVVSSSREVESERSAPLMRCTPASADQRVSQLQR